MIEQIDDEFIEEACELEFLDKVFSNNAAMMKRDDFIKRLSTEEFKWLFDMQLVRDKVNLWIEKGFGAAS